MKILLENLKENDIFKFKGKKYRLLYKSGVEYSCWNLDSNTTMKFPKLIEVILLS